MGNRKITAEPRAKMGRPKGPTLTAADHAAIQLIATEGFQTYHELSAGPLKDDNRTHRWDRMKRLVRMGLLRECHSDSGGILGWAIQPKGVGKHYAHAPQALQDAGKVPLYRTSFSHDVVLRRIKGYLTQSPAVTRWIPEHLLKAQVMREFQYFNHHDRREKLLLVPDALLHLQSGGTESKAALELELTQKARRRLYQKIEAYVVSEDFDYVFFVAKDENLKRLLLDVYREVVSRSTCVKIAKQQNGIYFSTLPLLQKHGVHAKFSGDHDTLSFADLSS
jgi:hypothetical protein